MKRKEKALGAYNKQYKGRNSKCGKYSHKPNDPNYPEDKKNKNADEKRRKWLQEKK